MEILEYPQTQVFPVVAIYQYHGLTQKILSGYLGGFMLMLLFIMVRNDVILLLFKLICKYLAYNDLWKYNISTNQWTWMSGSNDTNQPGLYGNIGVPSNSSVPGGRYASISWIDSENTLWLFGGASYISSVYKGINNTTVLTGANNC